VGIFDNCILACDIDGTLMENEYLNPKNIEKIDFFMNEGGKFSLSTGRALIAASEVAKLLKNVSPSVVTNGAVVFDFKEEKTILEKAVPKEDYRIVELVYNNFEKIGIEIHCRDKAFTLRRTSETDIHQLCEHFEAPDITFEEVSKYKWNKVNFFLNTLQEREELKSYLKDEKVSSKFVDTCAMLEGRMRYYYEILPFGVSKASALEELCGLMDIKKGGLFAIGDYYNDLEMLKMADIAAVPNTSPEEIKETAEYITVSCDEGAVADFIDYLTSKFNAN
jgi:Cof subfamily protein (haloacid dehalogenase superfamily)